MSIKIKQNQRDLIDRYELTITTIRDRTVTVTVGNYGGIGIQTGTLDANDARELARALELAADLADERVEVG